MFPGFLFVRTRSGLLHAPALVQKPGMTAAHTPSTPAAGRKRNRSFDETHAILIDVALRLISEYGEEALSIAAVARAARINRTTVYYHFAARDDLLQAVRAWSSAQLSTAFSGPESQADRMDWISRFVLDHPQLIRLWIEAFVSGGDIRASYPQWDALVEQTQIHFAMDRIDTEIFCTLLITGAVIGPHVFRNAVRPDLTDDAIIARFRKEHQRVLSELGMLREE